MAERRMFSKRITESDAFLDMPAEAQMLYLHLNMAADDDGFCDRPRAVMRHCGAGYDSMRILIAKKFVLSFDKNDGFIVVVKHWRMNNYIRKDIYHETKYREFMRELYYDENQAYTTEPGDGHESCLPRELPGPVTDPSRTRHAPVTDPSRIRDESLPQVRTGSESGKGSTGKVREEKERVSSDQASGVIRGSGRKEQTPAVPGGEKERPAEPAWKREARERCMRLGIWQEAPRAAP